MEDLLYSRFLDDDNGISGKIQSLVAEELLGKEQSEKIRLRYYDMKRNYFNYCKDEANEPDRKEWEFSKGLEPFTPKGWDRCYGDTITVPIPITHPDFIDLTERTEKRGAIGLDLPTWFNLENNEKRIMLVAQDPLRGNVWYSDIEIFPKEKDKRTGNKEDYVCVDALVASPFGLHGRSWRESKRGGARMRLLVEKLVGYGYGVYLTDCRKFFVYDHKESDIYSSGKNKYGKSIKGLYKDILKKEIGIIRPECIVAFGNQAYNYCSELLGDECRLKYFPHFSGAATWKAKEYFNIEGKIKIEELAEIYAQKISKFCIEIAGKDSQIL